MVWVVHRTVQRRDSHARLRSIIDSAVVGIIVINKKGRIEAFNPAAERLFGYPESEVLGRNVSLLMPSPHHEEHDGYLNRYLTTGDARIIGVGREVTGRRRDGSVFPLHLSVGEMSVAGQRMFTGTLHDLSDRVTLENRLRASEARWRSIIQSAVDGIVVIDAHGRIEAFNPGAERLFRYDRARGARQNVNMLMPSPYHEEHGRAVGPWSNGRAVAAVLRRSRRNSFRTCWGNRSAPTSLSVRDVPLNTLTQARAHRQRISLMPVSVDHNPLQSQEGRDTVMLARAARAACFSNRSPSARASTLTVAIDEFPRSRTRIAKAADSAG